MVKADNLARGRFEARLQRLLDGVKKGLPQALVIDKTAWNDQQLAQQLAEGLALFQRVRDAEAAVTIARGELHAALPDVHHFVSGLSKALAAYFGHASAELHEFGIWPGERRPLTAEQLAVTHAKSLATRRRSAGFWASASAWPCPDNQPTVVVLDHPPDET